MVFRAENGLDTNHILVYPYLHPYFSMNMDMDMNIKWISNTVGVVGQRRLQQYGSKDAAISAFCKKYVQWKGKAEAIA